MEAGLVSAFDGFRLQHDQPGAHLGSSLKGLGANDEVRVAGDRKQRSGRFTSPASPFGQSSSSPMNATSGAPSRSFQSSPAPDHNQTVSPTEELYSTSPHPDDASLARDEGERHEHENGETRKEYAGSSGSSSASETHSPIRPTPPQRNSSNQQQFHHAHAPPLHYPQHQPPLFYNSTSHASMPLSPPSLFNLVPGGSPSFTYHHLFPANPAMPPAAGAQHYQPPQSSNSYSTFAPPPPQGYTNGFGLGVGTEDGVQYAMGPGMGMSMGAPRRNPSPGFQIDADDDEIIETAIVIKSIPFSCPKDQLLGLMGSLQLPAPLAFNYHYDLSLNPASQQQEPRQDQFRGLAFANFRNGEEARIVVCALNGFEFMGRKLRAEFKKVLKPGEKEAIERNKALKRIRSVQLLAGGNGNANGSMNINGQSNGYGRAGSNGAGWGEPSGRNNGLSTRGGGGPGGPWIRREASSPGASGNGGGAGGGHHYRGYEPDETTTEEYGRLLDSQSHGQGGKTLFGQREYVVPSGIGMAYENSGESLGGGSGSADMSGSASGTGSLMSSGAGIGRTGGHSGSGSDSEEGVGSSVSAREERKKDLDLNDPQTLQLYSQLLLFSSSSTASTTEYEGMDVLERRKVKMVAKMLGLGCASEDLADGNKRVRLWKTSPTPSLRSTASAAPLRRPASTSSFHSTPTASSSFVPPPVPALPAFSAYLAAPNSGGLRGKKSMPEFRPSASSFYATDAPPMPTNPYSRSQLNGFNRKSTNNLRSESPAQYHTISSFPSSATKRGREIPSVQGIFQQQGVLSDSSSEDKMEYYSSGLGSIGAEAVRQPRGPGTAESSPARGLQEGGLEWRSRRN
ncbi:hypothetical protein JCM16303_006893 [Sporobolomyces ruberrimus]